MKIVIQRVKEAQVEVKETIIGKIGPGLLVFLGVAKEDAVKDADYLVNKVCQLRIFEDEQGKMNLSAKDVNADFLIISQFTLYGSCLKGRRPSFDRAAPPEKGEELYDYFVQQLKDEDVPVETGEFGAMMKVSLINDGPVTFVLDSDICRKE